MKKLLLPMLLLAPSIALSYQTTISAGSSHFDNGSSYSTNSSLSISHSIIDIDDSKGPLAVAEFLNKKSNIEVQHSEFYVDNSNPYDSSSTSIYGNYIYKEKFEAKVSYTLFDLLKNESSEYWSIGAGYYLSDSQKISTTIISDGDIDDFNVHYFGVHKPENETHYSVSSYLNHHNAGNYNRYSTGGSLSYYPNQYLSHSLSPAFSYTEYNSSLSGSSTEYYSLSYAVNYFVNRDFSSSISVYYSDSHSSNLFTGSNSTTGLSLSISNRF